MSTSLFEKINDDLKTALKQKSALVLSTLRLLKSDLQYEMSKDGSSSLSDEQVEALIKRSIKRRKESILQYEKANMLENAATEKQEMEILEKYLPESLGQEAIEKIVNELYASIQPQGPADMGKMMGAVMSKLKGKNVDGALVKDIVTKKLQG